MNKTSHNPIKIFVSDIQPIFPAIAGGRLRLAGIWGNVPDDMKVNYVGTFDSPGMNKTIRKLGQNGTETLVPCSSEHFAKMIYANAIFPDITLFDLAFHRFAHLSKNYLDESIMQLKNADVVVFSHPWSYPLLKPYIDTKKQYLVYDSQNVESFLRADVLLRTQYGRHGHELLEEILDIESDLVRNASLVLACSIRDSEQFISLYGTDKEKVVIAPNGVHVRTSTSKNKYLSKRRLKKKWGFKRPYTVVFSGSNFRPNIKALEYINEIAFNLPDIDFVVTGDMNNVISPQNQSNNIHMLGLLPQRALNEIYKLVDVGLNPMEYGSGSNIKVFTYMEARIPVISTPFGIRGLDVLDEFGYYEGVEILALATLDTFEQDLLNLLYDSNRREKLADRAYNMIMLNYSWKEISRRVCQMMKLKFQL